MRDRHISFRDVYDPIIKARLLQLILLLRSQNYQIVSDLNNRLTKWVDGNDRGKYIADHYKEMGFYYIQIISRTIAGDGKITIGYNLKNLFDDTVAFTSHERFKPSPDERLETQNYYNAGFRFFQEQGNPANGHILPHWDSSITENQNYKVMFTRTSSAFNPEHNTTGTPGTPLVPPGTPPGTPGTPGAQTAPAPNIVDTLKETFNNNPLYFVLGAGILLYFVFRE